MSYKAVHNTFWTDPEVSKYKPMVRYLYLYLISSPHTHYSGLYYLPLFYIEQETGLKMREIRDGIKFLNSMGHIEYDYERSIVFVKKEMLYQLDNVRDGKVIFNEKQLSGLRNHFNGLHGTPLIGKFLELYDYVKIEYRGINRGIHTPMDRDYSPSPYIYNIKEGGCGGEKKTGEEKSEEKEKKNSRHIIPPKLEWVISYCKERKNNVNPQRWFDHYQTKGWMVGKSKMVDWQAAVRTWETKTQLYQDKDDMLVKGEKILKKMKERGQI